MNSRTLTFGKNNKLTSIRYPRLSKRYTQIKKKTYESVSVSAECTLYTEHMYVLCVCGYETAWIGDTYNRVEKNKLKRKNDNKKEKNENYEGNVL